MKENVTITGASLGRLAKYFSEFILGPLVFVAAIAQIIQTEGVSHRATKVLLIVAGVIILAGLITIYLLIKGKDSRIWSTIRNWWSSLPIAPKAGALVASCFFYGLCSSRVHNYYLSWAITLISCLFFCLALYSAVPISVRGGFGAAALAMVGLGFALPPLRPPLPPPPPATACGAGSPERQLKMHGSNAIGTNLASTLAQRFLAKLGAQADEPCHPSSGETIVTGSLDKPKDYIVEIEDHESVKHISHLETDACHVAIGKFSPDLRFPYQRHFLGTDAIAVIVNKDNPVVAIEREDLRRIFDGEIGIWKNFRAENPYFAIHLYALEDSCDAREAFNSGIMRDSELSSNVLKLGSNELVQRVAQDKDGIGFVPRSVAQPFKDKVKSIGISGIHSQPVYPDEPDVTAGRYPLAFDIYVFTWRLNDYPLKEDFVDFAAFGEGQKFIRNAGLFPRDSMLRSSPDQGIRYEYRKLVADAIPLLPNFHFDYDRSTVRSSDIAQIKSLGDSSTYQGKEIIVMGFADGVGDEDHNLQLSRQRAGKVAEALRRHWKESDADIKVQGLGSEMAVASNATDDGQAMNRRVEIWLRDRPP